MLCKAAQVKYSMIKTNENQFPIGMMCRLLSVSRSGYYQWKLRPISDRKQANQLLTAEVKRVFVDLLIKKDGLAHQESPGTFKNKAGRPVGTVWPKLCGTTAGELKRLRNTKPLQTAITHYRWHLIYWSRTSRQLRPIKNGCLILCNNYFEY